MSDDRVTCTRCGLNRQCRCFNPIGAGLSTKARPFELGRDLAETPQRCPAFAPARAFAPTTTSETA